MLLCVSLKLPWHELSKRPCLRTFGGPCLRTFVGPWATWSCFNSCSASGQGCLHCDSSAAHQPSPVASACRASPAAQWQDQVGSASSALLCCMIVWRTVLCLGCHILMQHNRAKSSSSSFHKHIMIHESSILLADIPRYSFLARGSPSIRLHTISFPQLRNCSARPVSPGPARSELVWPSFSWSAPF